MKVRELTYEEWKELPDEIKYAEARKASREFEKLPKEEKERRARERDYQNAKDISDWYKNKAESDYYNDHAH